MKKFLLVIAAGLLACCPALAQRLPGGATPDHYSLTININFPNNNYEGDETIDLKLSKPSDSITLNAVEIDFTRYRSPRTVRHKPRRYPATRRTRPRPSPSPTSFPP